MTLKEYNRKRRFNETPEPKGEAETGSGPLRFVVQLHAATKLHYDFRLEWGGSFKSWAVPKGPSLNPNDQRLAVRTEDHPLAYGGFEGIIPKGNYGAGTVMIWDTGTLLERSSVDREGSEGKLSEGFAAGHITFLLTGHKLSGEFALIKLQKAGERNWLLVKKRDSYARYDIEVATFDRSVATGRSLAEIAGEARAKGEVWLPGKGAEDPATLKDPLPVSSTPQPRTKAKKVAAAPPKASATEPQSEKIPRQIKPMLHSEAPVTFSDGGWLFEPRMDGYRALGEVEKGRVRLYSRQGLPYAKAFPEIAKALKAIKAMLLVDGEVIVLDENGRPAADLLKAYSRDRVGRPVYMVYDLLHLDGKNLRTLPLKERKRLLAALPIWSESVHLVADLPDPDAAHKAAVDSGFNGVAARHGDSQYRSGVSPYWVRLPLPAREAPRVVLTHVERMYFPDDGITKGDVIEYYRAVASFLLPHLKDRPESLNRHPEGIQGEGFFHKDMQGFLPPWVETTQVKSESAGRSLNYLVCQNIETLLYMANLGCIEINPWLSRIPHLADLDYAVFDIDPDEQGFDDVIKVALAVRDVLAEIGAKGFCKTSGATGMHVYIPFAPGCSFDLGRSVAEGVARLVEARLPELTTTERAPARRRHKIYLDYMQNRRGQTVAAPYCIRPRPSAPVSTPLAWEEVRPGLQPGVFTLRTVPARLAAVGDLWAGLLDQPNEPEQCLARLRELSE